MARLMQQLVGHQKPIHVLRKMMAESRLPTSFILSGPSGIGKKMLVRGLLQIMLCQRDRESCGQCSYCLRAIEERNEFIYELNLQEKKKISVEQVRDLHSFLNLASMTSVRFVIIDPADQLSPAAANALLKVLEEPPAKTHFFLLTERLSSLLPTIRSRCQLVKMQRLSDSELAQIPGLEPQVAEWASGRPRLALELSGAHAKADPIGESFHFFKLLNLGEPQDWKKVLPSFFKSDQEREIVFQLWQTGLRRRLAGDSSPHLLPLPADDRALIALSQILQNAESAIERNVDKLLVLENIFYAWQRAVHSPEEALWNSTATF